MLPTFQAREALEIASAIGTVLFGEPEAIGGLVARATGSPDQGRLAEHAAKVSRMKAKADVERTKTSWR